MLLLKMLLKFGIVGLSGVVVNMAVFTYLTSLHVNYISAALFSFMAAVTNNFVWNLLWTFKGRANDTSLRKKYISFVSISVLNLGVNLLILRTMVECFDMQKITAQLIAIALTSGLNFALNYVITFGQSRFGQGKAVVNREADCHTNV